MHFTSEVTRARERERERDRERDRQRDRETESWLDEPPGHVEFDKHVKYPEAIALWGR